MLRGDVDKIAEHVVVPDFQRADAGRFGVADLQRGDDAARFVAQRARLVEGRFVSRRARSRRHAAKRGVRRRAPDQARRRVRRLARAVLQPREQDRAAIHPTPISARRSLLTRRCRREWRRGRADRRGRSRCGSRRAQDRVPLSGVRAVRRARRCRSRMLRPRLSDERSRPHRSAARRAAAPEAAIPPPSWCGQWRQGASRAARRRACG